MWPPRVAANLVGMADDRSRLRIGDGERDAAVEMLQEHHAAGRLDSSEYYTRMERVLQARTQIEVDQMFTDLPEPKPHAPGTLAPYSAVTPASASESIYDADVDTMGEGTDPWYAQWWMILVAVGLTVVTRGNIGFVIPMMAIWLWVIYPSLSSTKMRHQQARQRRMNAPYQPPGYAVTLTADQRRRITGQLDAGRNIHAIKLYREFTGAGLKEAKLAIDNWDRQIGY